MGPKHMKIPNGIIIIIKEIKIKAEIKGTTRDMDGCEMRIECEAG